MTSRDEMVSALAEKFKDSPEELARLLVQYANEADMASKSERIHFKWMPDVAAQELSTKIPGLTFNEKMSYVGDGLTHRLLVGDNIHSLAALQLEAGTYDLAYSDPPYNTGKTDFVYNDRFVDGEDGFKHSKWLSFMAPRLRLERELLKPTGIKIMAIGPQELHHARALMDSIYGEQNYIDTIVWTGRTDAQTDLVANTQDYMLIYAKSRSALKSRGTTWREEKPGVHEVLAAAAKIWGSLEESLAPADDATSAMRRWWASQPVDKFPKGMRQYDRIDDAGRLFRIDNLGFPGGGGYKYDVKHPTTGKVVKSPNRGWVCPEATMKRFLEEGRVVFGPDENQVPGYKRFLTEHLTAPPQAFFSADRSRARKHLERVMGNADERGSFSYPKDHQVLSRWFGMVAGKDAKIIDIFAGSGSTLEAALTLNKRDGGSRTVTLCTNNENNIGYGITRERCVRVMSGKDWADKKVHAPLGGNLAVFDVATFDPGLALRKLISDPLILDDERNEWTRQFHATIASAAGYPWLLEDTDGVAVYGDDPTSPTRTALIGYDMMQSVWEGVQPLKAKYPNPTIYGIEFNELPGETYLSEADVFIPGKQYRLFDRAARMIEPGRHYLDLVGRLETILEK